ncbi:MAG: MqnA/MqnD/SBP family protein [Campylobacterota bacterium]|nr:MqnA/MqnD/SBP family protein [Campylobacterota bacterium]
MIFGSISYLNLLPFQVFLKRALPRSQSQQSIRFRRDVPSTINSAFKRRDINAAFISSITSGKCRCTDLGIIADGPVYSVFVVPGKDEIDTESATSNILAKVLGLHGKVVIGDKALQSFLAGTEGIDLALQWKEKTDLPFVFARLCYNGYGKKIEALASSFTKQPVKIPQYVLKKEAKKRGISPRELLWYLDHIHYNMDHRAKKSLKKFLKLGRVLCPHNTQWSNNQNDTGILSEESSTKKVL